ncbi:Uncharacterised protein [uncultured archaeon]|nr:Uncharacterised protein [uncultured archaeon]
MTCRVDESYPLQSSYLSPKNSCVGCMKKAFQFRLYPNKNQEAGLEACQSGLSIDTMKQEAILLVGW